MPRKSNTVTLFVFLALHGLVIECVTAWLAMCDFDKDMCGWSVMSASGGLRWKRRQQVMNECGNKIDSDYRPSEQGLMIGSFAALDVSNKKPNGSRSRIRVRIGQRPRVKAISVSFYYASTKCAGEAPSVSLHVRRDVDYYEKFAEVQEDTGGLWVLKEFHTCVGKNPIIMYFEGEKVSKNALVGLDYVVISQSIMNCPTSAPTSSPSPSTTATTTAATTEVTTETTTQATTAATTEATTETTTEATTETTTETTTEATTETTTEATTEAITEATTETTTEYTTEATTAAPMTTAATTTNTTTALNETTTNSPATKVLVSTTLMIMVTMASWLTSR